MPENPYQPPKEVNEPDYRSLWANRAWFMFWLIVGLGVLSVYVRLFIWPFVWYFLLSPPETFFSFRALSAYT